MPEKVMSPVSAISTHIVSAVGTGVEDHWNSMVSGEVGIKKHTEASLSSVPFFGSRIGEETWEEIRRHTPTAPLLSPFEQMCIWSAKKALSSVTLNLDDTILILSSTKGNIEWLDQVEDERILLHTSAGIIATHLGIKQRPLVVSHACISGVAASLYGMRLLQSGRCSNVIVIGADRFTKFVLSGFQSFQATADEPCRPFDAHRKGINLGEAAATIILSTDQKQQPLARLVSGATSNDANHISGPSRTGEELAIAIRRSLDTASIHPSQIGMVSAHGTATLYNDEMEANAFTLSGVAAKPIHSFKGYIGHTLGAAGVVEAAMIIESLGRQQLIASAGFKELGVSQSLNITQQSVSAKIEYVLKTASGFGGCNAAAIWAKA